MFNFFLLFNPPSFKFLLECIHFLWPIHNNNELIILKHWNNCLNWCRACVLVFQSLDCSALAMYNKMLQCLANVFIIDYHHCSPYYHCHNLNDCAPLLDCYYLFYNNKIGIEVISGIKLLSPKRSSPFLTTKNDTEKDKIIISGIIIVEITIIAVTIATIRPSTTTATSLLSSQPLLLPPLPPSSPPFLPSFPFSALLSSLLNKNILKQSLIHYHQHNCHQQIPPPPPLPSLLSSIICSTF